LDDAGAGDELTGCEPGRGRYVTMAVSTPVGTGISPSSCTGAAGSGTVSSASAEGWSALAAVDRARAGPGPAAARTRSAARAAGVKRRVRCMDGLRIGPRVGPRARGLRVGGPLSTPPHGTLRADAPAHSQREVGTARNASTRAARSRVPKYARGLSDSEC